MTLNTNLLNATRRQFIKTAAVGTGGLAVGFTLSPLSLAAADGNFRADAFIEITPDNRILFTCPRDEMGQGVTTGMSTLVAEELDVAPQRLDVRLAPVDDAYTNPDIDMQATGGSTAVRAHHLPLRQAGANIRAVILRAASMDLGLPVEQLRTEDAHVIAGGKRHPYGRFAATAATLELPQEAPLKDPADFRYIGKDFPRLDGMAKSTGTAVFGIDVDIPGLHRAVVVRSPVAGGKLAALRADKARRMPGVTDVVEISSGAAVVAEHFWQAKKAAEALDVEWEQPELAGVNTAQVRADFAADLAEGDGVSTAEAGDLEEGFAAAQTTVDNQYWTPYLAHAPLEPMNAAVRVNGDGTAEVWTGSQAPIGAQGMAARALDMDGEDITVHSAYMGGGFGRRATLGHVHEAAELAKATGKPIQVIWTREDDMRHGVYRAASLMRIRAGVDGDGAITAWEATRVGGNNTPTTVKNLVPAVFPGMPQMFVNFAASAAGKVTSDWTVDESSVEGLHEDYDLPNRRVNHITRDHGLPLTFWRSVGHSYTAFAKETTVDELAERAGLDPVEFRLRNTRQNPRLAGVIRVAGEAMERGPARAGRTLGMAAHGSFHSYVAQVAEVSVKNGRIRVHKVLCAVDCGRAINPDIVRAQMEGAIMFGLTAALHGKLELADGAIVESNFHDYPILRMNEAPEVEVVIIDSDADPSGVGEPGLPPIAPAVANAVYRATGQRLRELPLKFT